MPQSDPNEQSIWRLSQLVQPNVHPPPPPQFVTNGGWAGGLADTIEDP